MGQEGSKKDNYKRRWLSGDLIRQFQAAAAAPVAPRDNTIDEYHGVKVADPHRPLEDLDAPETATWVQGHNKRFEKFIENSPTIDRTKKFLEKIWNYPKQGLPSRYGNKYFSYHNTGLQSQSVYMVQDSLKDTPRAVLDPNSWSKDGTVALSGAYPSPDGKLVAYTVSDAGSDELTLKIRDVATGKDLPDVITGLRFTGAYWDRNSSQGFTYNAPSNDGNKRFATCHHTIGDKPENDQLVFEVSDPDSFVDVGRFEKSDYEYASVTIGTLRTNGLWLRNKATNEPFRQLFENDVATFSPVAEINGKIYVVTDHNAPRGKLVALDPAHPEPENWQTIIAEPANTDVLDSVFFHQQQIFAFFSHDCAEQAKIYDLNGNYKHDMPIPPQSVVSFASIRENDKEFLLRVSNFQQPGATYRYDIASNALSLVQPSTAVETLEDCIVERLQATSKDGTQVPMTVIRRPDTDIDGSAAVKLYGYGGFNSPLGPGYSFDIVNWVRSGGIYVQANLRGGGEFGKDWYDQGRLLNKQNVFDDFAACAEELITKDYTSPARLVIEGGSNGGLLTAATALQRPELFGAVISEVPVTDMFRYHLHTYGRYWKSDYGDIENSIADFRAAAAYSPLHNVKVGGVYPPTLVMTADHDDRVVPSHAYKFAATLHQSHPETLALLRVDANAGHGAGKPTQKVIQEMAEVQAFIEAAIGPVDQKAYKKVLPAWLAQHSQNNDTSGQSPNSPSGP